MSDPHSILLNAHDVLRGDARHEGFDHECSYSLLKRHFHDPVFKLLSGDSGWKPAEPGTWQFISYLLGEMDSHGSSLVDSRLGDENATMVAHTLACASVDVFACKCSVTASNTRHGQVTCFMLHHGSFLNPLPVQMLTWQSIWSDDVYEQLGALWHVKSNFIALLPSLKGKSDPVDPLQLIAQRQFNADAIEETDRWS
ncbi:MAG: hypothetical protein AAFN41_09850 [Planctomycetota bacterium]